MATVIDYSAGVPRASSVKGAGHVGAVRYISPPRESWMKGKPLRRDEVNDFESQGLKLAMVWQFGKEKSPDVMRGAVGGELDARAAQVHLDSIGCSNYPVFFAVDFDISLDQWNNVAVHYFRAAAKVLGKQRVGIYGHSRVVHWAMEDGVVAEVEPGRVLGWVTKSWSRGATGRDYSVLYQNVHNVAGPDGVQIDINEVVHPEWGWRPLGKIPEKREPVKPSREFNIKPNPGHRGDPHFLPDVLRAFGVPVEFPDGWDKWGMGDFDRIWGVCVHHTGSNNTSAEYIARNAGLSGALSSQLHQKRTRPYAMTLCGVGIAWHMGRGSYPGLPTNAANDRMIGIEPQSNGTDPWPPGMLDIYYRAVAAILWYLGHNSSRCISHWEYSLIAQGKWDPGAGDGVSGHVMDMNHFRARVQHYIDNPPFMEGIEDMSLDLNKRYQYRTPEGYFEGEKPGTGTLEDIWLNTDTHSWVARVNTEKILAQNEKILELLESVVSLTSGRKDTDQSLANAISSLADAIRKDK